MNVKKAQRLLKKSAKTIGAFVGTEKIEEFITETLVEYENIEVYAIKYTQSLNKSNFKYGVLGLSIYRALRNCFKFEKEEGIHALTEILSHMNVNILESSWIKRFMISRVGKIRALKNGMEKKIYSLTEPNGWKMKRCKSDAYLAFDVYKCGLYDWLKEQKAEEICSVFCKMDYITAKYMEGLKLVRTKTIADGDEVCDFRYVKID